jgi:hypothetical protein
MKEREVEMGILVLLLIGYVIWKCVSNAPVSTGEEDREFEEMCLSLQDVDDDFDVF